GQCPGPARCERHVAAMIAPPRETGKCKSVTAAPWRRGYSKAWEPQLQLKCHNITARGGVHGASILGPRGGEYCSRSRGISATAAADIRSPPSSVPARWSR